MALLLTLNVHFFSLCLEVSIFVILVFVVIITVAIAIVNILKILSISNSCLLWHIFGRRILFLKSPLWATVQNIGDIVEILPNKEILVEK